MQALRALPVNITSESLPTPTGNQSTFNLIPDGQIALNESQLPGQPIRTGVNASMTGADADINRLNGTVFNGGNATDGEGWAMVLQRELANRYMASAFCSWRATGGSIQGAVPRISDPELNVTGSIGKDGHVSYRFLLGTSSSATLAHCCLTCSRCLRSFPTWMLTLRVVVENTPSRYVSRAIFSLQC